MRGIIYCDIIDRGNVAFGGQGHRVQTASASLLSYFLYYYHHHHYYWVYPLCAPHFAPHTLRPILCTVILCTPNFAPSYFAPILCDPHFAPQTWQLAPHTLRPTFCAPILCTLALCALVLCALTFSDTNTFCNKLHRSIALIYRPILILSFVYVLFKQN